MNPNVGENQRQIEAMPPASDKEQVPTKSGEEKLTVSPENSPQTKSVAISSQAANDMALPSQSIASVLTDDSPATITSPSQADDSDRIEKQWVDKAKTVIERTKDDPFEQKNQMSRVKADYIQKRFNKTLKADDAVAK
jgi:hypothetical protein